MQQPLLQAALGQHPERHPIWFMRQAGRYLPEYMELRKKHSFVEACKAPDVASEITLQPLRRFDLDAAIIFSDILMIPSLFGQELRFDKGHGPVLTPTFDDTSLIDKYQDVEYDQSLDFVGEAISKVRASLENSKTVIGFAGSPFTVLCYMVDGRGSKNFQKSQTLLYNHPKHFHKLLKSIARTTLDYLKMQVKAGAGIVMLFDSWANILPDHKYREFVYPVTNQLLKDLKDICPSIYYPGQDASRLYQLGSCHADVLSIDWRVSLERANKILKSVDCHKVLQGNLNPNAALASEETLRAEVRKVLENAKDLKGHIFNVGHGLTPLTPIPSIEAIIDEIRS